MFNTATWDAINQTLPVYLGAGEMLPSERPERVIERFGAKAAAELLPILKMIVHEMNVIQIDWTKHSLVSGMEEAMAHIKAEYPELSDAALKELGRLFAWGWR